MCDDYYYYEEQRKAEAKSEAALAGTIWFKICYFIMRFLIFYQLTLTQI